MHHTGHGKFLSNTQILGENYFSIDTTRKLTIKEKIGNKSRHLKHTHDTSIRANHDKQEGCLHKQIHIWKHQTASKFVSM